LPTIISEIMLKAKGLRVHHLPFRVFEHYGVETTTVMHPTNKIEEIALYKRATMKEICLHQRNNKTLYKQKKLQHKKSMRNSFNLNELYLSSWTIHLSTEKDKEHNDTSENVHLVLESIKRKFKRLKVENNGESGDEVFYTCNCCLIGTTLK